MRPLQRGDTIADLVRAACTLGTAIGAIVGLLPRLGNRVVTAVVYCAIVAVAVYIFVVHGFAGAFVGKVQKGAEAILYPVTAGQEVKKELL
jgi:hypothetical protein